MTASDPGAAFHDLAKAVAERVCVPFLGAGISLGATWPTKNEALRRFVWVLSQSLGLIKAGKIEQEARRRGGKRRKTLILSGKYLTLLRSLRLRASRSLFSSFGCSMRLNPHKTPQSQSIYANRCVTAGRSAR